MTDKVFRGFFWWQAGRRRARLDALDLVATHGALAYRVARHMAIDERMGKVIDVTLPRGHWARVRREVKRLERLL